MDSANDPQEITELLTHVRAGRAGAWDDLLARVHAELREMAHRRMQDERTGHVLQTTALVNEAFLRLVRGPTRAQHRGEFFAVAASAMRHVLVDEARRRNAQKRGGAARALTTSALASLPDHAAPTQDDALDLEALEGALVALERDERHAKKSKLVELRFFVGLTLEESAEVLGVSLATVKRDWEFARAWLRRELGRAT